MNNTANLNCEGISTHNINDAGELETLRSEMKKLKAIIASQQIVNNRMMRNAMDTSISRERKEIRFSIIMAASASLVAMALHPLIGLPMWFCLLTVAFMITAIAASIHTLRKHMSINMAEDNLLEWHRKSLPTRSLATNGSSSPFPSSCFGSLSSIKYWLTTSRANCSPAHSMAE